MGAGAGGCIDWGRRGPAHSVENPTLDGSRLDGRLTLALPHGSRSHQNADFGVHPRCRTELALHLQERVHSGALNGPNG